MYLLAIKHSETSNHDRLLAMKIVWLLSLLISSSLALSQEVCTKRNFIFLIHGVGGTAKTFGSLSAILNQKDPCFLAKPFVYSTGSNSTTADFANDFDGFVEKNLKQNNATDNDKISLIMHSQGGLVASLWLNQIKIQKPNLFAMVDAFITLSTPYWGSHMAKAGQRFLFTLPEEVDNPISPFGRKELEGMRYGSTNIKDLHNNFESIFGSESKIRKLAVGGLRSNYSSYTGEDDTTVGIYSSRPDHYKLEKSIDVNVKTGEILASQFTKTNYFQFVPVVATHFPLDVPGIANIPANCLGALPNKKCTHPSLPLILEHLYGNTIKVQKSYSFKNYRVQIYLEGMKELGLKNEDAEIRIFNTQLRVLLPIRNLKRATSPEAAVTFSGALKIPKPEIAEVELKIKGLLTRTIFIPIEGGHSSIVRLKLGPANDI